MRTSLVILGIAVVAGVSLLTIGSKYIGAKAPDATLPVSPATTAPKPAEAAQLGSPVSHAADNRREIKARYHSVASISSPVERDKEYAALAGYAAAAGDFELALEITGDVAASGDRDESYARIVHQALTVRDFTSADKAAKKISSVLLRDEQFRKIVQSCPANTSTEGAPSVPGLETATRAGALARSDREF